uniref:Rho GTPase activating protein 24 n=1 Tax=Sinocyclocheilus grahami TaxID=75366 RepID=A0A672Q1W3_SINGR
MDEQAGSTGSSPQHGRGSAKQDVLRCGWLRKQGGFVKTWHTRWFVLRGDQLYYYKDEDETKALGTIFLPGNRVTEHPSNGDEGGKFLFEVIPGGDRERMTSNHETYLLMASTQNDMEDWVKSIRRVIWAPFGGGELLQPKTKETVRAQRVRDCNKGQKELRKDHQKMKRQPQSNTDVHTVASLLKLYLRELPEPVIPFCKYEEFLACTKLLSKDQDAGMKELKRQVEGLPPVNYNLLKYICKFLDEVQSYSGVNKMSVQNLATVFGPNILRPKVEDPVTIMEGTVLVQQLMAILIGHHDVLFPPDEDHTSTLELVNNNNNETQKRPTNGQIQNKENNNTSGVRQCTWDTPESPSRAPLDNGSPRSGSPRNGFTGQRFEVARSPPISLKKNPAFSKGSGIVTNGSFSSSSSSSGDTNQEKIQTLPNMGTLHARRTGAIKGSGTKMGIQNGIVRMGVSSADVTNGTLNGRNGLWVPNGHVTMREAKSRDAEHQQNRLSTYDNVHIHQQQPTQPSLSSSCEDKQSVDSATWSTSSCEISLPENSTSCRSSTTTCPEQDFFGSNFEDPLLDGREDNGLAVDDREQRTSNGGGQGSRGTSSSDNSETFAVTNGPTNHSALHSLVASLKQEMLKQKNEYEARIKSLELRNLELETVMANLHEELDQEKKKYTMVEIKLRNAERAKDDAEKRNEMLQKEMEQFFSTFGDLTADPRQPDRANTIWIQ